jgi:mRNA interferase YafQ
MREPKLTTSFKKDMKRQKKRGKPKEKLLTLMEVICRDGEAPEECSPHNLIGNWVNHRECHIEPDWLLIYVVEEKHVTFHRTGTHSDLFR